MDKEKRAKKYELPEWAKKQRQMQSENVKKMYLQPIGGNLIGRWK